MTPKQWQTVFALVKASQGRAEKSADPVASVMQVEEPVSSGPETVASTIAGEAHPSSPKEHLALLRGATLGRYVVLNLLGTGGMGVVYAAYDPELDRKVALKLLHPTRANFWQNADGRARLVREAQAMARLAHPNVIVVHDVGTFHDDVFVAMEYVDGCTLRQWLDAEPREWSDIVDMFVQAGRGLSAAHSAGIVHRDFKPDNVLVGKDGRARVLDFGLALGTIPAEAAQTVQIIGDGLSAATIGPSALAHDMTKTGALIGTPNYMAPEQMVGERVDARTDQFSFCVALYQALYGELPFEGTKLPERLVAIQQGRVKNVQASTRLPGQIRDAIVQGLAANPAARYRSMDLLLQKLQRHPNKAWRRFAATAGVLLLVSLTAWASYRIEHNRRLVCRGAQEKLGSVWGESQKQALSAAFLATGLPYAADAVRGVNRVLDEYARRWVAMETEACEATRLRGEQSDELLDLRMSCLSQRREELKALARIFATADSQVVEKAVAAAQGLSDIEGCGDIEALKAPLKPPADMAARAKVEEVRLKLSHVWALNEAGRYGEAMPVATLATKDGQSLGYRPLEAEMLFHLGYTLSKTGDYRQSEETMLKAALTADSARHDEIAARAWGQLIAISQLQAKYNETELWAKLALNAIDRIGGNDRLLFNTLNNLGNVYKERGRYEEALDYYRRGLASAERAHDDRLLARVLHNIGTILLLQAKYDEALPQFQRVLALKEQTFGPLHPELGTTLNNIGVLMMRQHKHDEALTYYQRSSEIIERSLGSDHPELARDFNNIGFIFVLKGNYEEGLGWLERARRINEKALGHDHPSVGMNLFKMGDVYMRSGQPARAIRLFERSLEIFQSKGIDPVSVASAQFGLALALSRLKREPKRARALAEQAREGFKQVEGLKKELAEVENWLAKNSSK